MKRVFLIAYALQFLTIGGTSNAATQPAPCAAPANHEFDFWVGSWRVADRTGKFQGTNNVTREFNGCVIQEHWAGAGGSRGSSFNTFLPTVNKWQQTWVDNSGLTLHLMGGLTGNTMILSGNRTASDGTQLTDRISWTPLPDGRVRQHWQQRDTHQNWHDVFDGYYSRQ